MFWRRCAALLFLHICPLACLLMPPCPPGCCCTHSGSSVLCESLGLRSLPRSVPPTTTVLSVAKNRLCNVDHALGPLRGLQELSLSHNLLTRFPRGLPPSLESLLLQENRLTYITSGALRQLRNLTRLHLEDNRIAAVQPGALLALGRLRVLTLRGNRLRGLPLQLPSSLTQLDVSGNCISSLDLPSLAALIHLQVLKVNSNCLRSVPENTFDSLPHLRSVDLANNLWLCECNILYLYRWLLSGRLKMATDLVCKEPLHLAHHLLLSLPVMSICPCVLTPVDKEHSAAKPSNQSLCSNTGDSRVWRDKLPKGTALSKAASKDLPATRILPFSLDTLTFEECLALNKTSTERPFNPTTAATAAAAVSHYEDGACKGNTTAPSVQQNTSAEESWPSIGEEHVSLTLNQLALTQQNFTLIVTLLTLLFVLLCLTLLAVLVVLKKLLVRQQRVAPADAGSGG